MADCGLGNDDRRRDEAAAHAVVRDGEGAVLHVARGERAASGALGQVLQPLRGGRASRCGAPSGWDRLGFEDVAPQAIYGHEFAHHIQFAHDYFSDPVPGATTIAGRTRYTELMADAMSAYFLTHKRGAAMNRKRVEQFLEVFFQVGDCRFTHPDHHGTPNQRTAAAQFGVDLADGQQKQGHILTSEQFHDLFVAAYADLVAPDAI
jgi:hypothetical protein